jgi:protein-arginine kinase activator protein McsA
MMKNNLWMIRFQMPKRKNVRSVWLNWLLRARRTPKSKKRRAAPKKELKELEEEIKEYLYHEDMETVKKLRDLHDNAPPSHQSKALSNSPQTSTSFQRCSHLDDLVKELYLYG